MVVGGLGKLDSELGIREGGGCESEANLGFLFLGSASSSGSGCYVSWRERRALPIGIHCTI
jgi:hypothetical protein